MIELIIYIFAIYGISFFVKEMDGPFDIMAKIRNLLMRIPLVNVFLYKLLSCYFCVGTYSGLAVYIIHNHLQHLNVYDMILWIFGGSTISMLGNLISNKLMEGSSGE